jgi:heptosyltransferase-2
MRAARKVERFSKGLLIRFLTRVIRTRSLTPDSARSCKKVLIVRQHNQMGDMLLAVPAFRALKSSYPGVEIGVVTSVLNRDVLLNNPYVDYVFSYNKKNPMSHVSLIRAVRSKHFDMVIVLHTVSFSLTSAILAVLSGAKIRAGSTSKPFGHDFSKALFHIELPLPDDKELENMNETEHNLYPLSYIGIETTDLAPLLVPFPEEEQWAVNFISQIRKDEDLLLAVHPGAGKAANIWPPYNFSGVVNKLGELVSLLVLVIEGPSDSRHVRAFCEACTRRCIIIKQRSIGEVASILKRCDLVLCNDTGIMHAACAAGARTLAVFGPTNAARWAPKCSSLSILRAPQGDLSKLFPESVLEKVVETLGSKVGT